MNKSETRLSTFDNHGYDSGSLIKKTIWYFFNIFFFKSYLFPFSYPKVVLLRIFGAHIGQRIVIKPSVNIKYPWNLTLGNDVWIGENVWIDNLAPVIIGDNVCISQGAMLLTGNHNYKKTSFDLITQNIILENGVWIGAMSVVCPGVICGSHAVLTVGSTATKNLLPYTINQGNPALEIKDRNIQS